MTWVDLGGIAADVCFAAFGMPATYTPAAGPPRALTVLRRGGETLLPGLGGGRQTHDGLLVEIRAADLPEMPVAGDRIDAAGQHYRVRSCRWADGERLLWLVDAVPG